VRQGGQIAIAHWWHLHWRAIMSKRSKRHQRAQRAQRAQRQAPQLRPPAIPVVEPGQGEAMRRMLVEDCLIVLASELLDDAATVAALRRLGVHGRLCSLMRQVFEWRANPTTAAELAVREELRRTPIAQRPEPFRSAGAPMPKAVTRD
jgi:hypothetical protein